jgi:hypothetical protein
MSNGFGVRALRERVVLRFQRVERSSALGRRLIRLLLHRIQRGGVVREMRNYERKRMHGELL